MKLRDFFYISISYCSIVYIFYLSRYSYFCPDAYAYTGLASKLKNGDFFDSVSGYWSPLYVWIIALFSTIFKIKLFLAAKFATILFGFFTLVITVFFVKKINVEKEPLNYIAYIFFSLLIADWATKVNTPDIMATFFLMIYFYFILFKSFENYLSSFICGFLAGFGYLSKLYIFPFFISHFIFSVFLKFRFDSKRKYFINILIGLGVLFFFVIIWKYILFQKNFLNI